MLHPPSAFIEHDGFNAVFCLRGQIMSGFAQMEEAKPVGQCCHGPDLRRPFNSGENLSPRRNSSAHER